MTPLPSVSPESEPEHSLSSLSRDYYCRETSAAGTRDYWPVFTLVQSRVISRSIRAS